MTLDTEDVATFLGTPSNEINKTDFVQYALEQKLLDANEANTRRKKKEKAERVDRLERYKRNSSVHVDDGGNQQSGLLCCLAFTEKQSSPKSPERMVQVATREKIEAAFKKFDLNEDGFIDWEEFQQVAID